MIELHQLTIDWLKVRRVGRATLATSLAAADLKTVNPIPFRALDQGRYGYPVSAGVEDKLIARMSTSTPIGGDELGSLTTQVDVLEAHRRSTLSGRQGRRHMLAHLQGEVDQQIKRDNRLSQLLAGVYHVSPGDA